jgi:polygalacturonase
MQKIPAKEVATDREVFGASDLDSTLKEIKGQKFMDFVNVKDFGAIGDGVTDDTQAFKDMFATNPEGVVIPQGTYLLSDNILGNSNVKIIANNATLKFSTRVAGAMLDFTSQENVFIEGIIFNMNMQNMPVYQESERETQYNLGLYFDSTENIEIKNCEFKNLYNKGIRLRSCNGYINIKNNKFTSPQQEQMARAEHIGLENMDYNTVSILIQNNIFDNVKPTSPGYGVCGIYFFNTANLRITNNTFNYCGRDNTGNHRLAVIDSYLGGRNVTIKNNILFNTQHHYFRVSRSKDFFIKDNYFHSDTLSADGICSNLNPGSSGDKYTAENIFIENNIFDSGNIDNSVRSARAIGGLPINYDHYYKNIHIKNNKFLGYSYALDFGLIADGFYIEDNIFDSKDVGINLYFPTSNISGTLTDAVVKNINIKNNEFNTGSSGLLFISESTGTVTKSNLINILNNKFYKKTEDNNNQAITTQYISPNIVNNIIEYYSIAIYVRQGTRAYIENNKMYNNSTPIADSENTNPIRNNNYSDDVSM